jgi:Holliday junction resolvasome RuvABC endonuclease subunit
MIVLGLDVSSTSTGWAVLKTGRFNKKEGTGYGWIKPPSKYSLGAKLSYFSNELHIIINNTHPDIIGIEDVFLGFKNVSTLKVLSRFSGVAIESVYTLLGQDAKILQVKEIRKALGAQDKQKAFDIISKKYKLTEWTFDKHNDVTDALAVAFCVNMLIKEEHKK